MGSPLPPQRFDSANPQIMAQWRRTGQVTGRWGQRVPDGRVAEERVNGATDATAGASDADATCRCHPIGQRVVSCTARCGSGSPTGGATGAASRHAPVGCSPRRRRRRSRRRRRVGQTEIHRRPETCTQPNRGRFIRALSVLGILRDAGSRFDRGAVLKWSHKLMWPFFCYSTGCGINGLFFFLNDVAN